MSDEDKIDIDSVTNLEEGVLRKSKNKWFIETEEDGLIPLTDFLDGFKNKEVRLSVVDLKESDHLANLVSERRDLS